MSLLTKILICCAGLCLAVFLVMAAAVLLCVFSALRLARRYPAAALYELRRGQEDYVSLGDISPHVLPYVLKLEDSFFYEHRGYDKWAIYNALKCNLRERSFAAGGSTITQQLAKNLYLPFRKTLRRKGTEFVLTLMLERKLTKDQILELYLNVVSFGGDLWGIGAAARYYFGKSAADLTSNQALLLLTLLPSPNGYNPLLHPDRYLAARERNLLYLTQIEILSPEQADAIRAAYPRDRLDEELIPHPPAEIPPASTHGNLCAAALRRQMDASRN